MGGGATPGQSPAPLAGARPVVEGRGECKVAAYSVITRCNLFGYHSHMIGRVRPQAVEGQVEKPGMVI